MTPGNVLLQQAREALAAGRLDEAERHCRAALVGSASPAPVWYLLGLVAHRRGQIEPAIGHLRQALQAEPDNADHHAHAAEVFRQGRRFAEAEAAARTALRLRPHLAAGHNNLGLVFQDQGRLAEAEAAYLQAVNADPGYARARLNLGVLYLRQDRLDAAGHCLRQALRLQPGYPQALNALGETVRRQGNPREAVSLLRQALQHRPDYPQALLNLGNALAEQGQWDEAAACLSRAVALQPGLAPAHHDLGALLERRGDLEGAVAAYERARHLRPDVPGHLAALENARRRVCDWGGRETNVPALIRSVRECLARDEPSPLWPLASCRFPTTNEDRLGIARQFARSLARQVDPGRVPLHRTAPPVPPGRVRLGFLGHEFRNAVAGHLLQGTFEFFDRSRFEVVLLDYSHDDGSPIRRRIHQGCDRVADLRAQTDEAMARRVAAEGVHVLVDVNSYMVGGRPAVAAWRPAPVQVSYMYPATTGADFIDYFLTDAVVTPAGHERFFTERLVYLPHCYLPTGGQEPVPAECPGRERWGLPAEGVVFCSFNAADKIAPQTFDVWMRILSRVPGSVLWQRDEGPLVQANLRREAGARGIDPGRLVFAPRVPSVADHLARHRHADLFLDTLEHGAHATAADALWAGLPLLTCPGETFASRVATSLLSTAGPTELIATSPDDFEQRAVALATDPTRLGALRERVAAARSASPLFALDRLVRSLGWAFQEMWRRHLAGEQPAPLTVPGV